MHQTPWKEYREDGHTYRIRADYGWHAIGTQEPYWSVTGTIERRAGARWRDDMGGCIHDEIVQHFPWLAPTIKWHLASQTSGPMHYEANARYWLEHALGRSAWPMRSYDRDPVEAFKRSVVFGAVATDTEMPTLEHLATWCAARLPALLVQMAADTDVALASHV